MVMSSRGSRANCSVPLLVLVLGSLAACGGGGGDGGGGSPPPPGIQSLTLRKDGGTAPDRIYAAEAHSDGSVYVGGTIAGQATFGSGEPTQTTASAGGLSDGFVARYDAALGFQWIRRVGGPGTASTNDVAVAPNGDCIITGSFEETASFDDGNGGSVILSSGLMTEDDAFVARYSSNGTLLWARHIYGPLGQRGNGVDIAADGTIYMTGFIDGTSTFGAGQTNGVTLPSFGGPDAFIARYAANGYFLWVTIAGGTLGDSARDIVVHPAGGCVITGRFFDQAAFGLFETNATTLTSAGQSDVFVARYGDDGKLVWARRAGGTEIDFGSAVTILADGSIAITGYFGGACTFGPGESGQQILQATGTRDLFVARMNGQGGLDNADRAGGNDFVQGLEIAGAPGGGFYVAGSVRGVAVFGPGEAGETTMVTAPGTTDGFLARFAVDGSLVWARRSGSGQNDSATAVTILPSGHALLCGDFTSTAMFCIGQPSAAMLTATGSTDVFLARHAPNGQLD